MKRLAVGLLFLAPLALAPFASTTARAAKSAATVLLDDGMTSVSLENGSSDKVLGYGFRVKGTLIGQAGDKDVITVDWRQGGKSLARARCEIEPRHNTFACKSPDQNLKALGAVEAHVAHVSDETDTAQLLRVLKFSVVDYRRPYLKNTTAPHAQVDAHGLLGAATASIDETRFVAPLTLRFWRAVPPSTIGSGGLDSIDVRCFVDGKRLTGDFVANLEKEAFLDRIGYPVKTKDGSSTTYEIAPYRLEFRKVVRLVAKTPDDEKRASLGSDTVQLQKNPGAWTCHLRSAGELVREFRFQVAADGTLVRHPEEDAEPRLNFPKGTVMAEVSVGTPAQFDHTFSTDAIKKGSWFGRPWSKAASKMLGSLTGAKTKA
jgi:hypothetical protein